MNLLAELNPQQREAVEITDGPILVLAGAGSGKTRVITYRIAHLIALGTSGHAVLAVTFTNKAADEMKQRISALLRHDGRDPGELWVSTFHSFCARFLRREAAQAGLKRDFSIYDDEDQTTVVKLAIKQLGHEENLLTPRALLERISRAKNDGRTAEQMEAEARDPRDRFAAKVFARYEETLHRAGALDFDDLLLRTLHAFRTRDELRAKWNERFQYLLVDEYQDTNRVQYELVRALAGERRNLCVVGDEDQSIYGWRGAELGNILRFAEDFPGARVVRIEQNYRSTQNILDAALGVVAKNQERLGKQLVATRGAGSRLQYFEARDAAGEAQFIRDEIRRLQGDALSCSIAVMYRTNAQGRVFEEVFTRAALRYRVLGGFSFFQRGEIKDALAYLRLLLNPSDDVALLRVLNTPPRGIGARTVEALREAARQNNTSLWDAMTRLNGSKASAPLREFRLMMESLAAQRETLSPAELLRLTLDRTTYLDLLEQRGSIEDRGRAENLHEMVNALAESSERGETLEEFLDQASLVSDADEYDERVPVTLLTLHSAKGLEFDHVFLTGMEEGVFPFARAMNSPREIEEERRLCYVGMTRARNTLTLTRAVYRRIFGNDLAESSQPSRFLAEIPGELIEAAAGSLAAPGETRRYEPDPEYSFSPEEFRRRARREAPPPVRRAPAAPRASRPFGSQRAPSNPLVGVRVRHPKYGVGTIIAVEGDDEERRLTVSFAGQGTKKLVERYANLERA